MMSLFVWLLVLLSPMYTEFEQALLRQQKEPDTARQDFLQIATRCDVEPQRHTADVHLIRLRSWYFAGDLPRALLAAHEGQLQYPTNQELQRDLELLRQEVGNAASHRPTPRRGWRETVSMTEQRFLYLAGLVLFVLGLGVGLTFRSRWAWWVTGLAVACWLATGLLQQQNNAELAAEREQPVVILTRQTTLRLGNGASYPAVLPQPLPPGSESRRIGQRGPWLQVQLADGTLGWLPEANTLTVTAPESRTIFQ